LRYHLQKNKLQPIKLLNPIRKENDTLLVFDDLCPQLADILSYNMSGREFRKVFNGMMLYCKLIEKKSTYEVTKTVKVSHYNIATGESAEESSELPWAEKKTVAPSQSHEHLSSWEQWEREVEQREWERNIGHDFH